MVVAALFVAYHGIRYFCFITGLQKHVDPKAVAGYFHCRIDEAQVVNFDNNYACDFSPRPNPSDIIIVTFINSAWVSLSKNWICSAEKAGLKDKLFLVGFESNVCSQVEGVPCYEHPDVSISGTSFGKPAYQKLMIERTRIILKLLSCGQRIALVDADITFLKDPFKYLNEIMESKDIVFQTDSSGVKVIDSVLSYFFRYICGGFIYMRSNGPIKHLWLSVLQYQNNFKWNDQAGLNICIRHHTQTVRWDVLNSEYFPNGRQYFYYNQSSENNLIVHANHLEGDDKLVRMIAADLWCEGDHAKKICSDPPENYHMSCSPDEGTTNIRDNNELKDSKESLEDKDNQKVLDGEGIREPEKASKEDTTRGTASKVEIDVIKDSAENDGGIRDPKKEKRRNQQSIPEWCGKFVKVCRTRFGVKVL